MPWAPSSPLAWRLLFAGDMYNAMRWGFLLLAAAGIGCAGEFVSPGRNGIGGGPAAPGAGSPGTGGGALPGTPGPPGMGPLMEVDFCADVQGPQPGPSPARRLGHVEYNNTVRSLFGDTSRPADGFLPDVVPNHGLFNTDALAQVTNAEHVQGYQSAAEAVAARAMANLGRWAPCELAAAPQTCGATIATTLAARAFRRPLTADERARYSSFYELQRTSAGPQAALTMVLEALLQSPSFLYRLEPDGADPAVAGVPRRVTGREMAVRLSYFTVRSPPDAELLRAADSGELASAENVAAQARRLLADPLARDAIHDFIGQWLGTQNLAGMAKSAAVFPEYFPGLNAALGEEFERYVDVALWESPDAVAELLGSSRGFANQRTAALYGISGVTGSALQAVTLDPKVRRGLLTMPALNFITSKEVGNLPPRRGKFVRTRLLCDQIAEPNNAFLEEAKKIVPPADASVRVAFQTVVNGATCQGCHRYIDGLGFGLDSYDALGRHRTVDDRGRPLDTSGSLVGFYTDAQLAVTAALPPAPFNDTQELVGLMATGERVAECFAKQVLEFSAGRLLDSPDRCMRQKLNQAWKRGGRSFTELLVALTQTDAFLYRTQTPASP